MDRQDLRRRIQTLKQRLYLLQKDALQRNEADPSNTVSGRRATVVDQELEAAMEEWRGASTKLKAPSDHDEWTVVHSEMQ